MTQDSSSGDFSARKEKPVDALQEMEKANKIYEEFPIYKYALFIGVFALETAIAFWIALSL